MAKGDHPRTQNAVDYRGGQAGNQLENTFANLLPQNQGLQNRFNVAADQAGNNYSDLYRSFGDLANQGNNSYNALMGQTQGSYGNLMNQAQGAYGPQQALYSQFAQTGGYSPQDIQDLRARGIAPTRAVYANAQADLDRRNAIAGGNLANYAASKAKLTRDLGQSISDTNVNVNASIADAIRQGKLAGGAGLNTTANSQLGNLQSILGAGTGALTNQLGGQQTAIGNALGGARSLYGTAPGAASMYGSQLGQSNEQMNQIANLQNQLSQMLINGQLGVSNVPGNYQQALGNIGGTLNLAGQIASPLGNLLPGNQSVIPGKTQGPF